MKLTIKILEKGFKVVIVLFIFFISLNSTYAQTSCTQKLEQAEELYESGQIDKVEDLLKDCLDDGFNKDEKVRAYRLLTLSNLYYNEDHEAKNYMLSLLKVKPEYKIGESDPSEFINLHDEFRTMPVFIVGVKGGVGLLDIYDVGNYNDINSLENEPDYEPGNSYSLGVSLEIPIIKQFSVATEVFFNSYAYGYKDTILDYAAISFDEDIKTIDVPLLLQWNILENDLVPYVNLGASFNFLLSSKADLTRRDNEKGKYRDLPELNDMDLTDSRNSFNYSICVGAGLRWKNFLGRGYLTFDIRYYRYMKNLVEPASRANNDEMTFSGLKTDNSLKIQNTFFMIGYKLPIYLPKYKGKKK